MNRRAELITRLRAAGCVFAEDEADILREAAASGAELEAMTLQRIDGVPLEHLVGWVSFAGLRVKIDPGVFVPRQRTALLVREAAKRCDPNAIIVDLCCGNGAVGLAVAAVVGAVELHAVDIDAGAAACARRNLEPVGGTVYQGDLDQPLPPRLRGRVDVITANAPYVPTGAISLMPPEARLHEPRVALDGGPDGVDLHRRIAALASKWLRPGGSVLIETSASQSHLTMAAIVDNHLTPSAVADDDSGTTIVVGDHVR